MLHVHWALPDTATLCATVAADASIAGAMAAAKRPRAPAWMLSDAVATRPWHAQKQEHRAVQQEQHEQEPQAEVHALLEHLEQAQWQELTPVAAEALITGVCAGVLRRRRETTAPTVGTAPLPWHAAAAALQRDWRSILILYVVTGELQVCPIEW